MVVQIKILKTLFFCLKDTFGGTVSENIIETFRKLIVFEKFGKKYENTRDFYVINYAKITLTFDQVENDYFNAFRSATKPNRSFINKKKSLNFLVIRANLEG